MSFVTAPVLLFTVISGVQVLQPPNGASSCVRSGPSFSSKARLHLTKDLEELRITCVISTKSVVNWSGEVTHVPPECSVSHVPLVGNMFSTVCCAPGVP